jgi:hypothetical protein
MKVLLCWFSEASKEVSLLLGELLRKDLPFAEVCISAEDIHNGSQWLSEMPGLLEHTEFAILALTSKDVDSPWVLFEAGYLLRAMDGSNVRVIMVDLAVTGLSAPLGQLEAISTKKEDILKLTHSINQRSLESWNQGMTENELQNAFEIHWPKCESELLRLGRQAPKKMRSDREVLYEILELSRGIARAVGSPKVIDSGEGVKTPTKARPIGGARRSSADQEKIAELTRLVEELSTKKEGD